jgi:hypothetical protein
MKSKLRTGRFWTLSSMWSWMHTTIPKGRKSFMNWRWRNLTILVITRQQPLIRIYMMTSSQQFIYQEQKLLLPLQDKLVFISRNYEHSGNGGGNHNNNDNENGEGETFIDINRRNFLAINKPHLIYFWQKMDEGNILQYILTVSNKMLQQVPTVFQVL